MRTGGHGVEALLADIGPQTLATEYLDRQQNSHSRRARDSPGMPRIPDHGRDTSTGQEYMLSLERKVLDLHARRAQARLEVIKGVCQIIPLTNELVYAYWELVHQEAKALKDVENCIVFWGRTVEREAAGIR